VLVNRTPAALLGSSWLVRAIAALGEAGSRLPRGLLEDRFLIMVDHLTVVPGAPGVPSARDPGCRTPP
jgi:hypothetical protein